MKFSRCAAAALIFAALGLPTPVKLPAADNGAAVMILVNQAGYDAAGPKTILLQTDFDPAAIASFEVVRGNSAAASGSWQETR